MNKLSGNITVIIVNWNSGPLLNRCLDALDGQTLPPRQVIVVDNASADGSADRMETLHHEAKVVRLDENIGFASANNMAVRMAADSQWVALLNPDAFPAPDWLERLLSTAKNHPEFSSFASHMSNAANSEILDGTGDVYHVSGKMWRRDHGALARKRPRRSGEVFCACGASAMYRREDFMKVGGFDEEYFCYCEDVDLGFRLRLAGLRCLYAHDAVVAHVGSATTTRHSDFYIYHGQRNLVWTYVKNMPWPMLWLYLPQHLALNMGALILFSIKGKGRVALRAKWDAIKNLPAILRKRKKIQQTRKVTLLRLWREMAKGLGGFIPS